MPDAFTVNKNTVFYILLFKIKIFHNGILRSFLDFVRKVLLVPKLTPCYLIRMGEWLYILDKSQEKNGCGCSVRFTISSLSVPQVVTVHFCSCFSPKHSCHFRFTFFTNDNKQTNLNSLAQSYERRSERKCARKSTNGEKTTFIYSG